MTPHGFPLAASAAPDHGEEQAQAHREVVGSPEPKDHEAWGHSEQGKGQEC